MVHNIRNETTSLIGVGGARVTATETGQAGVFGKSRIVPGSGAICISQRQFGDKFQMINPHKDLVILRGWPHTRYANCEYHFTRDSEDQLLHCKLKTTGEMAMVARVAKFYRPDELPNGPGGAGRSITDALEPQKAMEIRRLLRAIQLKMSSRAEVGNQVGVVHLEPEELRGRRAEPITPRDQVLRSLKAKRSLSRRECARRSI